MIYLYKVIGMWVYIIWYGKNICLSVRTMTLEESIQFSLNLINRNIYIDFKSSSEIGKICIFLTSLTTRSTFSKEIIIPSAVWLLLEYIIYLFIYLSKTYGGNRYRVMRPTAAPVNEETVKCFSAWVLNFWRNK